MNNIVQLIERETGYKIANKSRKREIVYIRYQMYYALRKHTNLSFNLIGRLTGHDHATVMHGVDISEFFIKTDEKYRKEYLNIERVVCGEISQKRMQRTEKLLCDLQNRIVGASISGVICEIWQRRAIKLDNWINSINNK